MSKKKKKDKFDSGTMVRLLARERVGIVPSSKIFKDKKKKDKDVIDFDEEM